MSSNETLYVDATNQIAGRLASKVAEQILLGKRVVVLNAEKSLISGAKTSVINQWKTSLELSSRVNPKYGPFHPRRPDNILRRMVRGMTPRTKPSGLAAMKRLRVYIGTPPDVKPVKMTEFKDTAAPRPIPVYVTMAELSRNLGWHE